LQNDEIAQNNALISYYYQINPNQLSDTQWSKKVAEMFWVLNYNGELTKKK